MSGTSMDGIDAVIVRFHNDQPQLVNSLSHPWPRALQDRLSQLTTNHTVTLQELGQLDLLCGRQFAAATLQLLSKANIDTKEICAIGSHGQTIFHHPQAPVPFSFQIGDPNTIAERTGITVVADFRRRDMAAGGQGAPLVPAFHQALFHHPQRNRVILNIGGIANITILAADGTIKSGFDTGPGNCLMDRWIQKNLSRPYDQDGSWAQTGKVQQPLLEQLLDDAYFSQEPPKSTGTEYFSMAWLDQHLATCPQPKAQNIQATLLQLTANSIQQAIQHWAAETQEVLVCGGGVHNSTLIDALTQQLGNTPVITTAQSTAAIDPDWVEAIAFAWLARQTLHGKTGNIPAVTGASHPVVLGGIYPAGAFISPTT
ncbi:MAG TPA: anhydro-N-acetylmuramic acid kinase [Thiolapillus brandeum]|uniref:Anhydro-N-acetylmuramic acid kinase n=1 Tax=Thiolapillus brandeum TaxID=1076588 RepID=A0A831NTI1_9GAMM|nr:anhydro-N-acetylmuramic acid kinase [Thiolapillus brandeum]